MQSEKFLEFCLSSWKLLNCANLVFSVFSHDFRFSSAREQGSCQTFDGFVAKKMLAALLDPWTSAWTLVIWGVLGDDDFPVESPYFSFSGVDGGDALAMVVSFPEFAFAKPLFVVVLLGPFLTISTYFQ
jgi:hypothetical protein